ncbi:MAG: hypothetical protein DRR08_16695 [Candidatus Parabeggiatoa sp. nov. 2]|nr:MAG: hypothetical protein B6247_10140 [Beggiatoa sp. 4572_84]RKZ58316.1 MAG: hypothetical protein DRR08_16695 [Gammaproteobacteria bacterium]
MSNKIVSSIPNSEKIDRIVQAILQTPTPENSQPWKIVVRENVLEVFHSYERAKLATFPDDLSVLGIGMIAETIELAGSTEGLEARFTFLLEERSDEHPWLRAELNTVDNLSPAPLAQALFLRHSDRRYYAGGSVDDPVFQEVRQEAAAIQGANLYFTEKYPDEYLQLLKNADQIALKWPEFCEDMTRWVRFTDKEIEKTRDGMSWRSFLRKNPNWLYYLRSRLWWLATRLGWFPPSLQKLESYIFDDSSEPSPSSYDDGAGIGCITTLSASVEDLVASGRLVLRLWLLLNLRGYGFQPITNLPAIIYPQRLGTFNLPNSLNDLVANGYETLQQVFGFSEPELPIFCFRTGRAMGEYPAIARTLRRTDHVCYR